MKIFKSLLFWLFFAIPMALGIFYYSTIASPQYEATAHFTIEKQGKGQSDPLGSLTGMPGSVSSTRDALIVKDFIESREVIERTKKYFDLNALYAREDKDYLSRLKQNSSIEDIVEYWQKKVTIEFDTASGIVNLNVTAFEPESAVKVINAILKVSEELVNNLSEKSRQDSLKFARRELKKAEAKLKKTRTDVRNFRENEQALSPEQSAESKLKLVEELEAERARAEASLRSLRLEFPDTSRKIIEAKNKVFSLKKQVNIERIRSNKITNNSDAKTMSSIISKHEELLTEQGFAEKSYESALLNLEQSRIDATQQHRYLTVIVPPKLPEKPVKPDQPNDYIVLFLSCLLLWGILSLVIASIKDHAGWS